ncbi:MAG: NDP-sugar synthase [Candidatus Thermoplasmatota archaeon]
MEAIILAGGFGTRLRPFTYTRAKCLLPILNKPMIQYLIDSLPDEVDTVILAVNYRKEQIESYFSTHPCEKEIIINNEPEPLGTGGAVKFAEKHITGPFFVLNADVISSLNLADMMRFHHRKKAFTTISLWPVENVSEFGVVNMKKDGNVIGFVEKPKPEDAPSNLINAGAYLLNNTVLDYIPTGRLVSMEKEIFPLIIKNTKKFYGYQIKGYWIDVGRIPSYIDVNKMLLQKQGLKNLQGENCAVHGELINTCIGNHVRIGHNSTLNSCIIFDHVTIGENVHLGNCIIGENCVIEHNSNLIITAIGDNEHIKQNTRLENAIIWTQPIPPGYPKKQIGNVIGE